MDKPLIPDVSVIVPVFNTPLNYFKECLESLHNQTLSNAEFIIVFDGEDKPLYSFCEDYSRQDRRFRLFVQPHFGVSATRNYGISQAEGEYITFVDADDSIENDCCEATYAFAKKNESEVVLFDYTATSKQYSQRKYHQESINELSSLQIAELQEQTICLKDEKFIASVSTWCKLIKSELIKTNALSFPQNTTIAVDRPFSYSIYLNAKKISYLSKAFYNYNKLDNSITWKKYDDKLPLLLAHLSDIKRISDKHSDVIAFQAIQIFFYCWRDCYFRNENRNNWTKQVEKICKVARSKEFQNLITSSKKIKNNPVVAFEVWLIKHNITLHIWLHAIKWKFFG